MWFCRADIAAVCGGDKDRATRVSSLTNEEPLVVVKSCVDVVWEVVGEDCGDSRYSVIREGETSLCRGRCGIVHERTFSTEDGDISRGVGSGIHRRLEVFATRRGDEDVVGVNGDFLVKRSEEESVENFLSDLGGSGRHRQ